MSDENSPWKVGAEVGNPGPRRTDRRSEVVTPEDAFRAGAEAALNQLLPMIPVGAEKDARRWVAALPLPPTPPEMMQADRLPAKSGSDGQMTTRGPEMLSGGSPLIASERDANDVRASRDSRERPAPASPRQEDREALARLIFSGDPAHYDRHWQEVALKVAEPNAYLIAFSGLAGSGKDTAAQAIDPSWVRVKFAAPLKAMTRALLEDACLPEDQITRMIEGNRKDRWHWALGGHTCRYAMQTLGTEWGRELMRHDFWTFLAGMKIDRARVTGSNVVITDCRFQNEVDTIHELGGVVIRVTRPGQVRASAHASEDLPPFDYELINDGTVADLHQKVRDSLPLWLDYEPNHK